MLVFDIPVVQDGAALDSVQRRACPRPLHLNLFPTSPPPLINHIHIFVERCHISKYPAGLIPGSHQHYSG